MADAPTPTDTTGSGGSAGGYHNIDSLPLGKILQVSFTKIHRLKKRRPK